MGPGGVGTGGGAPVLMLLLIVGGVALVAFGVVTNYRNTKRRRSAIAATVAAHGLAYMPTDPARTTACASPPFGVGDHRRATTKPRPTVSRSRGCRSRLP